MIQFDTADKDESLFSRARLGCNQEREDPVFSPLGWGRVPCPWDLQYLGSLVYYSPCHTNLPGDVRSSERPMRSHALSCTVL